MVVGGGGIELMSVIVFSPQIPAPADLPFFFPVILFYFLVYFVSMSHIVWHVMAWWRLEFEKVYEISMV